MKKRKTVCMVLCLLLSILNGWAFAGASPADGAMAQESGTIEGQANTYVGVVRVPEGERFAPIIKGFYGSDPASGGFYPGTLAEIHGKEDGFFSVIIGNVIGKMEEKYIEQTEELVDPSRGILPRGYGIPIGETVSDTSLRGFSDKALPFDDRSENSYLVGMSMFCMSAPGDDAQLTMFALDGFLPQSAVELFWLKDLYTPERKDISQGKGVAGKDFTPGMYTFTIEEGSEGALTVAIGGRTDEYKAAGEAVFTLYLSEGAEISLEGGALHPATQEDPFTMEGLDTYTGNGQFFILYGDVGSTYEVTVPEGTEEGRYSVYTLRYADGKGELFETMELAPGESQWFILRPGDFVRVENCVFHAMRSNG